MKYILSVLFLLLTTTNVLAQDTRFHPAQTESEKALDNIFKQVSDNITPTDKFSENFYNKFKSRENISDLFCVAYFIDDNPLYSTIENNDNYSIITYSSSETGEYSPYYKMSKIHDTWKLDGIFCDESFNINMPQYAKEYCNRENLPQGSIKGCETQKINLYQEQLQKLINNIQQKLSTSPKKLKEFNQAQEAWQKYIDAEADFLYSGIEASWISHKCLLSFSEQHIKNRIQQLENLLNNATQKDLCKTELK